MFGKSDLLSSTAYSRGFVDAVESRLYCDGCYPPHRLIVLFPGPVFSAPSQRQYRQGWLAGIALPARAHA
jgi:hypothetical protein